MLGVVLILLRNVIVCFGIALASPSSDLRHGPIGRMDAHTNAHTQLMRHEIRAASGSARSPASTPQHGHAITITLASEEHIVPKPTLSELLPVEFRRSTPTTGIPSSRGPTVKLLAMTPVSGTPASPPVSGTPSLPSIPAATQGQNSAVPVSHEIRPESGSGANPVRTAPYPSGGAATVAVSVPHVADMNNGTMTSAGAAATGPPPSNSTSSTRAEEASLVHQHIGLCIGLSALALVSMCWLLWLTPADKRELVDRFKKTPCTQIARVFALLLLYNFFIVSLPFFGFMFDGCFISSCSGWLTVATLACTCLPQTLDMLKLPAPQFVKSLEVGLAASAICSLANGTSGIIEAALYGDTGCKNTFLALSVGLVLDGILFGWALYRGEGGWLIRRAMGVLDTTHSSS